MSPLPELEPMLEALIFASKEPLSIEKMLEALHSSDLIELKNKDIKDALKILEERWQNPERLCGRGLVLRKLAGGYAFLSAPEHAFAVKKIIQAKPIELSKAQTEILAIVAYRQPLTRVDIDDIRGVDSSFALKKLMQLKLLKILGKSEGLGRPLLYGTTREFLEFFALNSLNDLPTLKQFESLSSNDEEIPSEHTGDVTFKDLFSESHQNTMFSSEIERLSDEALQGLDEALTFVEQVEKSAKE
jgi:segregation and condensation protein B